MIGSLGLKRLRVISQTSTSSLSACYSYKLLGTFDLSPIIFVINMLGHITLKTGICSSASLLGSCLKLIWKKANWMVHYLRICIIAIWPQSLFWSGIHCGLANNIFKFLFFRKKAFGYCLYFIIFKTIFFIFINWVIHWSTVRSFFEGWYLFIL